MDHKIKFAMIGGGPDSMIGPIHRYAARLDGLYNLTAGVFSRDIEKSKKIALDENIPLNRIYNTVDEMLQRESAIRSQEKLNVITIATPNNSHYKDAKAALLAGYHIILEKPMTTSLLQAKELQEIAYKKDRHCLMMYSYSGYPMIKEARHRIINDEIGKVNRINIIFNQGWLSNNNPNHIWRQNKTISGPTGTVADIGTHCFYLSEYLTNLKVEEISADLAYLHYNLDVDANILMRFPTDIKGALTISQVATGERSNLLIQIYGDNGSLIWTQENMDELKILRRNHHAEIVYAGNNNENLSNIAKSNCRTPLGHPEGFLSAFANLYRNFALFLKNKTTEGLEFPDAHQGVRSMAFIEAVLHSFRYNGKWTILHNM